MEINKVHNIDFLNNDLPDKCAKLIIADPPYYKVKGEFDFIWKTFDDYLTDAEKWAIECKRILADNGTLFWWGDKKNIAYSQIILDRYFELENSLVWRKVDSMQYQYYSPDLARTFNTHNERLLMYSSKENEINTFAEYLNNRIIENKISKKEIQILYPSKTGGLTGCVSNWLNGDNIMTKEQYSILRSVFGVDIFDRQYESLYNEYEKNRRFFYNDLKFEEVLEFSQEGHITKEYDHDTKKPEKLTRALILTCSRENDLVVVPFAGSGTECAMSAKEKRPFVGYEITEKHAKMSQERANKILKEPTLF
jgi:site-specific DNA-methyltransferase (adenine-specific)